MRRVATEVDHAPNHREHDHVHPFETSPDLRQFCKEVGIIFLLSCRTPTHVYTEHVRANSKQDVERHTTKENHKKGHPLEVFKHRLQKSGFADAIAHDSKANVRHDVENENQSYEY